MCKTDSADAYELLSPWEFTKSNIINTCTTHNMAQWNSPKQLFFNEDELKDMQQASTDGVAKHERTIPPEPEVTKAAGATVGDISWNYMPLTGVTRNTFPSSMVNAPDFVPKQKVAGREPTDSAVTLRRHVPELTRKVAPLPVKFEDPTILQRSLNAPEFIPMPREHFAGSAPMTSAPAKLTTTSVFDEVTANSLTQSSRDVLEPLSMDPLHEHGRQLTGSRPTEFETPPGVVALGPLQRVPDEVAKVFEAQGARPKEQMTWDPASGPETFGVHTQATLHTVATGSAYRQDDTVATSRRRIECARGKTPMSLAPDTASQLENICRLMELSARLSLENVLHTAIPAAPTMMTSPTMMTPLTLPPMTQPTLQCQFCKTNGERRSMFTSHALRNAHGHVTCPILRRYVCPICGETGNNAHTVSYCPRGGGISTISAAQTPRKSCGCIRNCRHGDVKYH